MTDMLQHALVRRPGENFCNGVTTADLGRPDLATTLAQHTAYCDALRAAGLAVTVLEADPAYPDGCFVEDAAVVLAHCAVITLPGAPSRQGEQRAIEAVLADHRPIRSIRRPGTLEGGDVLRLGRQLFVGLSARTNQAGADQLAAIAAEGGYAVTHVPVRDVLHLKTTITAVDDRTLIAAGAMADEGAFGDFRVIQAPPDEPYAANCLLLNDRLLAPAGFPGVLDLLGATGQTVCEVPVGEFRKMDGGLTCLSLLW